MLPKIVDILAINETRLDSTIQNGVVSIPGYTLERKDRNRSGGGVALYIRDSINYKRLTDHLEDNMELICIQVSKPKIKPFIMCTWYRPPGSTIEMMNRFEVVLQKLDSYHMEVNIIGDINCNVGAISPDCSTQKLLDICDTYQYSQLIDQPTRITQHTSSIIDLFLSNDPQNFSLMSRNARNNEKDDFGKISSNSSNRKNSQNNANDLTNLTKFRQNRQIICIILAVFTV